MNKFKFGTRHANSSVFVGLKLCKHQLFVYHSRPVCNNAAPLETRKIEITELTWPWPVGNKLKKIWSRFYGHVWTPIDGSVGQLPVKDRQQSWKNEKTANGKKYSFSFKSEFAPFGGILFIWYVVVPRECSEHASKRPMGFKSCAYVVAYPNSIRCHTSTWKERFHDQKFLSKLW